MGPYGSLWVPMGPYGSLAAPLHVADVARVVPCLAATTVTAGSSKAANDQAIRSCRDWRVALKLLHLAELQGQKLETWGFGCVLGWDVWRCSKCEKTGKF